uniref:Uncharacterized protein n=1 Tax=Arundo donax TaxID=35708 RepID=A0A0A9GL31_ARUDO
MIHESDMQTNRMACLTFSYINQTHTIYYSPLITIFQLIKLQLHVNLFISSESRTSKSVRNLTAQAN